MTEPRSKSRPRFAVRVLGGLPDAQRARYSERQLAKGFKVSSYNTAGAPEALLRACVMELYGDQPPYEGPIRIEALFALSRAKWAAKKTERIYLSFRKPDFDNLQKLFDALNTTKRLGPGLWLDDQQIVGVNMAKAYAEPGDAAHIELAIYGLRSDLTETK